MQDSKNTAHIGAMHVMCTAEKLVLAHRQTDRQTDTHTHTQTHRQTHHQHVGLE